MVNDLRRWDVRNEQHDTSGWEGGPNNYVDAFPQLVGAVQARRDDDLLGVPRYRYWALLRGGDAVAVFDTDGVVHLRDGRSQDLTHLYRERGRSLTAVLGAALGGVLP